MRNGTEESIEELLQRLPDGAAIVRRGKYWEFWQDGRHVSGSAGLRTLLEMEVQAKDRSCPFRATCRQSFCMKYGGCDTPAARAASRQLTQELTILKRKVR
jgi:hypothetical protein